MTIPSRKALPWTLLGALIGLIAALYTASPAFADYTVPSSYYAYGVGSGGAAFWSQGSLIGTTGADDWDSYAGVNKFVSWTMGTDCGNNKSCVIYSNDGAYIYGTSCYIPELGGVWYGTTHILAGSDYHSLSGGDCTSYGSHTYPIFIVVVDDEKSGWTSDRISHTGRHETGHTLYLNEADAGGFINCWSSGGLWYPLMKNVSSGCSAYPANKQPTTNEINAVISRNGW